MEAALATFGRHAVAEQLVGALAGDPVIEHVERRPVAPRTRRWAAATLRSAADALAPAETAPRQLAAGC